MNGRRGVAMRPERTAKSIGFSVCRISPNGARTQRKNAKIARKRTTGGTSARPRARTPARSRQPQTRSAARASAASGSATAGIGTGPQPGNEPARQRRGHEADGERERERDLRARVVLLVAPEKPRDNGRPRRARQEEDRGEEKRGQDRHGTNQGNTTRPRGRARLGRVNAPSPRIAVVGGGLAGLVAADRLLGAGMRVTVFEKYPEAGGLVGVVDGGRHAARALLPSPLHERRRLRLLRRGVRPRRRHPVAEVADGVLLGRAGSSTSARPRRSSRSRRSESRAASSSSSRR